MAIAFQNGTEKKAHGPFIINDEYVCHNRV